MDFHYRAAASDGSILTGLRNAPSADQLSATLKGEGLIPLEIRIGTQVKLLLGFPERALKELPVFTRQLAGLLQAGIRLNRSLDILIDLSKGRLKAILTEIGRDIREGRSFSAALEKHPKVFDQAYIAMVKTGEASGRLPEVLTRIAESMEAEREFTGEILTSLMYPAIVTTVSIIALILLMTFVIPRFETLFHRIGQQLPLITRIVVAISHGLTRYGILILIGAFIAGTALTGALRSPSGRLKVDRLILKVPVLGEMLLQLEMERMTRMLSMLMSSGVTLLNSLTILPGLLRNRVLATSLTDAAEAVRIGNGLSRHLARQNVFPPLAVAMIGVGEEGGNLGPMMEQVARVYARETRQSFRRLTSLIGPVMILILAGFIFLVALAILLPVYQLRIDG